MREIALITVTGQDQRGLTAKLTRIMSEHHLDILDMGQSVIHNNVSLGMLVQLPEGESGATAIKQLMYAAHELNMTIRLSPVGSDEYENWVARQGQQHYIVTLLARKLTAENIAMMSEVVTKYGLNIENITRLTGRVSQTLAKNSKACVEFLLSGSPNDEAQMRAEFLAISTENSMDIAFQEDNVFRRNRRLVVFDMDSTLIEAEVIDELAKRTGTGEQVAAITEEAMQGKIDFQESFRRRMALLKGLDESVLAEIATQLPITEGAERLISNLRRLGYKTAILSGGFTYFARYLQTHLGMDYVYANELEIENGKVTGNVTGEIVDGAKKAELMQAIAQRENIRLEQVIAVGDGANDLPMLSLAGLGIAFRAKPIVKQKAGHSISTLGLDGILYLLGFRDRDID